MNSDSCTLQFLFYDVLLLVLFFTPLTSSVHNNKWLVFIVNGFHYFFLFSGAEVSETPKVVLSETQPVGNASQVSSYATFMVSFRSFHEKSFNAFLSYWPTIRNGTRDVFGLVGLDGVSIIVSLYSPGIWHWLFVCLINSTCIRLLCSVGRKYCEQSLAPYFGKNCDLFFMLKIWNATQMQGLKAEVNIQ